jgi:predicted N-formylglutamate amidohydrolase
LFVCDHAGRETPRSLSRLGLRQDVFDLHIAWDIGAGAVGRRLAASMGAAFIAQRYSRLVVDCNRAPDRPQAIPEISDGVTIPGNLDLSEADRQARVAEIHAPYHAAIARELDARAARGQGTIVVFVHSFTPRMGGLDRPWHFGVVREPRSPFSKTFLDRLSNIDGLVVGDNQPYAMDGIDYSVVVHALDRGLDYLELEIRQDLVADEAGQARTSALLQETLVAVAPAEVRPR